jgi:hypothetical protein
MEENISSLIYASIGFEIGGPSGSNLKLRVSKKDLYKKLIVKLNNSHKIKQ